MHTSKSAKPTVVEELAAFVVRSNYEAISSAATQQIKIHVLDAIGCAIGALGAPPIKALRAQTEEFGGKLQATLIGGGKTAPDRAAFYNSSAERYLDFMDSFVAKGETCHPADNIMPVLAAGEYAQISGKEFIAAVAVAYQVQCRLSQVAPVREKGYDHTVQGAYAVAAGVAKALELNEVQTANAIAMAGASYIALRVTRSGNLSNWKGLAYANMAFGATSVAFLAKRDVTGPLEVFEGKGGLMDAITGKFAVNWAKEDLEMILKTNIKKYNAEFHAQTTMEASLELRSSDGFKVQDIKKIELRIFDVAYNIIGGGNDGDKSHVSTKEEADHSLPYMIAVALLDGEVTPAQYDPMRILKKDVQELMQKVTISSSKTMSERFPAEMPCHIKVEMTDGTKFDVKKHDYEGFYTRPMSWDKVVEKFNTLADGHSSKAQREQLISFVKDLEKKEISELSKLLQFQVQKAPAHA